MAIDCTTALRTDAQLSGTCDTCGRPLVDWRNPPRPDHPGISCGGTCLACQYEFERDFPEDVRCGAPVFADRDGERPPKRPKWSLRNRREAYDLLRRTGLSRVESLRTLFNV